MGDLASWLGECVTWTLNDGEKPILRGGVREDRGEFEDSQDVPCVRSKGITGLFILGTVGWTDGGARYSGVV